MSALIAKLNLGVAASAVAGPVVPATTRAVTMGYVDSIGTAAGLKIYEVWVSTTPASDALFTAIATQANTRLGAGW